MAILHRFYCICVLNDAINVCSIKTQYSKIVIILDRADPKLVVPVVYLKGSND